MDILWDKQQHMQEVQLAIQIENLQKGFIGFKAASYGDWCPYTNLTTADDSGDWAGLYVSENPQIAKGYREDYLDPTSGNGTAYLHEVHLLHDVKLVVCDDARLGNGEMPQAEKATLVREQLPQTIRLAGPLIPQLGRQGYFFKGYHDEGGNMEIIVPNKLSAVVLLMKKVTYQYHRWDLVRIT